MNILRNCFLALSLLTAVSCTKEPHDVPGTTDEGREAVIGFSISAVPEAVGMPKSRAIEDGKVDEGTDADYQVTDFWLLQYNQNGVQIGSPRYYEMSDFADDETMALPVILPTEAGVTYLCAVIANTHAPAFSSTLSSATTLEKLKTVYKNISNADDMYEGVSDTAGDLLMNGTAEVTSSTTTLDCQLYRNVAKLTLQLTNKEGSGVKITSVQLRNVPDRVFYADRLYDGADAPSPTIDESGFVDLPIEACELTAGEEMKELVYYLPRNCRGTSGADRESNKNVDAPAYATYLEIMAEDAERLTPLRYRFYLGQNMTNDFNIVPNHHYTLPITIADKGDATTDNRVEDMGEVELAESNSYIINPTSGEAQTIYAVPITRINKFWRSADGDGTEPVNTSTQWVAEVIWQDQPTRMINFCSADGSVAENNTSYEGQGNDFFYFKPTAGASGNVLIGVRKKDAGKDAYLWSWHLWITDYDPEYSSAWQEGTYFYHVTGGYVHRYAGDTWETKYKNRYIMDRNLGAASNARFAGLDKTRGLYYQFGRKDPFPANIPLYGIDGQPQTAFTAKENDCISIVKGVTWFRVAVNHPYTFYYPESGSGDWAKDNSYTSNLWNNPQWYSEGDTDESGKSLFDPCPPGWKLPETGVWDVFATTIDGLTNRPNASNYNIEPGESDYQGGTPNAGWFFFMGGVGTGGTAWYPASGYRTVSSGAVSNAQINGYYWAATPLSMALGRYLYFYSTYAYPHYSYNRGSGFPVRCVQE